MTGLPLWLLEPIAEPEDPAWQGRSIWRQVVIAAATAGEAMHLAESIGQDPEAATIGNESDSRLAGFADEKLYALRRISDEDAATYSAGVREAAIVLAVPSNDES